MGSRLQPRFNLQTSDVLQLLAKLHSETEAYRTVALIRETVILLTPIIQTHGSS